MGKAVSRKHLSLAISAILLGSVLAGGALELGLRLVSIEAVEVHRRAPVREESQQKFFVYDPILGWLGRPNVEETFSGWEFATRVHLNTMGFRDARELGTKLPGFYRVVVFGDSITWGYGVEEGERFSDLLSGLLSGRGVQVEVLNVAVNGYDTGQELLLYRRIGMRSCADLVIVGLYENDLRESVSAWQGPYAKPYFRLVEGRLELANVPVPQADWASLQEAQQTELKRWLREHVRLYALAAWARETLRSILAQSPSVPNVEEPGMMLTARLLRQFQQEVTEAGGRFAVILLPDQRILDQGDGEALRRVAEEAGIEAVVDLAPRFREVPIAQRRRLFYRLDGAHWTSEAHAFSARHIAASLKDAGIFDRPPRPCLSAHQSDGA
jgi:lysophospholipase L1-like esterase